MTRVSVEVREDHIERLNRSPVQGIAELVWNALDADADRIDVVLLKNDLDGLDGVVVEDDGHGMSHMDALQEFKPLGGSSKQYRPATRNKKRTMHGRAGQGRFGPFGIKCQRIRWGTVAEEAPGLLTEIVVDRADQTVFEVGDPIATDRRHGTRVSIEGITDVVPSLDRDVAAPKLTSILALHLGKYPQIAVTYDGVRLEPASVQSHVERYQINVGSDEAVLTVIEWSIKQVDRHIYLCSPDGAALGEVRAGIQAPGFEFTAYLSSPLMRELEAELGLAELHHERLSPLIEAAQEKLRDHFRRRQGELQASVIEEWKEQDLYPYTEELSDPVEVAKREVFDAVAVRAAPLVNATTNDTARKLSLHLMKQALETGPESLRRIFGEVMGLSDQARAELDSLLQRTTLTAIITASRRIADRLDFLTGLEVLLFDDENKHTLTERGQLHRIVAAEPWIFGEEFALAVDDQGLRTLLRKHIELLGREELAPDEDAMDQEGRRRVDLMLGRAMPERENVQHHLVVELKRPSVKVGIDELSQIRRYAFKVATDERFDQRGTKWDFIVVSNELDALAEEEAKSSDRPVGLLHRGENYEVWARTWAEIIRLCRHRLKFAQQALGYMASAETGLEYLRTRHADHVPDHLSDPA